MFQFKVRQNPLDFQFQNLVSIDIFDKFNDKANTFRPLIRITSQFTSNTKVYSSSANFTKKERYVQLETLCTTNSAAENLLQGVIYVGSTDFPLGFYDIIVYENTATANLDPTGLNIVYYGVMNLSVADGLSHSSSEPVVYTEYTTNDTDTEAVYVTSTGAY
tara:strand:+ start:1908 stop:2393 length:486 start_codon:yes stop_codon:yes gene_type:complete